MGKGERKRRQRIKKKAHQAAEAFVAEAAEVCEICGLPAESEPGEPRCLLFGECGDFAGDGEEGAGAKEKLLAYLRTGSWSPRLVWSYSHNCMGLCDLWSWRPVQFKKRWAGMPSGRWILFWTRKVWTWTKWGNSRNVIGCVTLLWTKRMLKICSTILVSVRLVIIQLERSFLDVLCMEWSLLSLWFIITFYGGVLNLATSVVVPNWDLPGSTCLLRCFGHCSYNSESRDEGQRLGPKWPRSVRPGYPQSVASSLSSFI